MVIERENWSSSTSKPFLFISAIYTKLIKKRKVLMLKEAGHLANTLHLANTTIIVFMPIFLCNLLSLSAKNILKCFNPWTDNFASCWLHNLGLYSWICVWNPESERVSLFASTTHKNSPRQPIPETRSAWWLAWNNKSLCQTTTASLSTAVDPLGTAQDQE